MKRVLTNMKIFPEEVGHLTKLNPQDAWLSITESRNGNTYYAAFHNLNVGIGLQALILPVAFTFLGWSWGIVSLSIAYIWQLCTMWVLIRLYEAVPGKFCINDLGSMNVNDLNSSASGMGKFYVPDLGSGNSSGPLHEGSSDNSVPSNPKTVQYSRAKGRKIPLSWELSQPSFLFGCQ